MGNMAGPSRSCHVSSQEIVHLLETDEPLSDFSGESTASDDYTGNQSDSDSDISIGAEKNEASNPTQTHDVDWVRGGS
jgi:hypothetical protein